MGCENCFNFQEKEIETPEDENKNKNQNNDENDFSSPDSSKLVREESENLLNSNSKKIIEIKNSQFIEEVLFEINKYRKRHHADELILDENICKIAQRYAEKMARESVLELSGNKYQDRELGEIIFSSNNKLTPKDLVDIWYNDGSENYNYKTETLNPSNFTQLIWKDSKYFGLGHAITRDNKFYIVANFYPCGNIKGQFVKNISCKTSRYPSKSYVSVFSDTEEFFDEFLSTLNELRIKHGAPPLILNANLLEMAQNRADLLSKNKKLFSQNNNYMNKNFGENLFISSKKCSEKEVISEWYKGIKKYNFKNINENNFNDRELKNFAQMVWKNTKEVGFGYKFDDNGYFYFVANYYPCGNIKGEYQDNVLPIQ